MTITECRVKLAHEAVERLLGFASVTLDGVFVVRDLKIIDGERGVFIAMPSRKIMDRCPYIPCRDKNHLRARFCNGCGKQLDPYRAERYLESIHDPAHDVLAPSPRIKLHADVCHPINSYGRDLITRAVLREFEAERTRAEQPGYRCTYDDIDVEHERTINMIDARHI